MPRDGTERIRTIDPMFWSHPKTLAVMEQEPLALLLLLGIRSRPADDAGRFRADPRSLKVLILPLIPQATPEWIEESLAVLEQARLLHLYELNGTKYGVIHDWHDWQKINRPTPSVFPAPPPELCPCCGGAVPEHSPTPPRLLTEDSVNTPEEAPTPPRVLSEDSVNTPEESVTPQLLLTAGREGKGKERRGTDKASTPAVASVRAPKPRGRASPLPPACSWCTHPTGESAPLVQRLAQVYHDAYREQHGECPLPLSETRDWPALRRLAHGTRSFARIAAVLRHGVSSQDPFLVKNGHRVAVLAEHYQGIAQALDQGECHGAPAHPDGSGGSGRSARRHSPAPASDYGPSGETAF